MTRTIRACPLTADAFRPFGEVIEPDNASEIRLINGGTTTRFHAIAPIATAGGDPVLSIFRGKPFDLPVTVAIMERHPQGSQAFVPLRPRPYLVVVAPDDGGRPGEPVAFLCDGTKGVSYPPGAWHHPLLALEAVSDFLVVDRESPETNLEEAAYGDPWVIVAE